MGKSIEHPNRAHAHARPKTCRLKIRGRNWKVIIGRPPMNRCTGTCTLPDRTIHIRASAPNKFETLVHEILHACHWDLTEEAILETEEAIVKGLRLLERTCFRTRKSTSGPAA